MEVDYMAKHKRTTANFQKIFLKIDGSSKVPTNLIPPKRFIIGLQEINFELKLSLSKKFTLNLIQLRGVKRIKSFIIKTDYFNYNRLALGN